MQPWNDEAISIYRERIKDLQKFKDMAQKSNSLPFKIKFKVISYDINVAMLSAALEKRGLQ